jgi:hypothetical protein
MDDTKRQADTNATALGNVVDELRKAKEQLQPIYEEYRQKNDDWTPGWWDHAEDELDEKARKVMIASEQAIAPHAEKIAAPEPYRFEAGAKFTDDHTFVPGDTPGESKGSGEGHGGDQSSVPHDPPPALPGHEAYVPAGSEPGSSGGVGLAGVPISMLPPSPPASAPVVPTSQNPGLTPPVFMPGPGWTSGGSPLPGGRLPSGPLAPFGGGKGSAMPSGAVIGGPARGAPPGAGRKSVTPSWLPEEPGAGGRPSGTGTNAMIGSGATGSRGGGRGDKNGKHFDPDNPWATAEGVDPVIEPSRREHRHDPGPGVIGRHE